MTRMSEFVFHSPWAFALLVALPMALVCLYQSHRRRITPDPLDAPEATTQRLWGLLLGALVALIAGLAFAGAAVLQEPGPAEPWLIASLSALSLTALLAALALALKRQSQPAFLFPGLGLLKTIPGGRPSPLRYLAPLLRMAALLLLVLALARPQVATTEADVSTEGMDIVITQDVSTSMEAVDFAPPGQRQPLARIKGAKDVIARFIEQRPTDRLGLVVFSAEAFTQCPLTLDHSVLRNILTAIRTGVIEDGTAIGNALLVSINRLRDSDAKSKVIILVTDGDDNASKIAPEQAARLAADQGIHIFPILVGRGGRVPYPMKTAFGGTEYVPVEIRTNPELLRRIAETARGKFYQAVDQQSLAEDFQDILDQMEKTRLMDPGRFTRHAEVFQLALLPALLALLLDLALGWTRFRQFP